MVVLPQCCPVAPMNIFLHMVLFLARFFQNVRVLEVHKLYRLISRLSATTVVLLNSYLNKLYFGLFVRHQEYTIILIIRQFLVKDASRPEYAAYRKIGLTEPRQSSSLLKTLGEFRLRAANNRDPSYLIRVIPA